MHPTLCFLTFTFKMQDRYFIPLWRACSLSLPSGKTKVEHLHGMQSSWIRGSANGRAKSEGAIMMMKIAWVHFAKTSDNNTLQTPLLCVLTLGVLIHSLCIAFSPPSLWLQPKFTSYLAVHLSSFSFNLIYSIYLEKLCSSPHRI